MTLDSLPFWAPITTTIIYPPYSPPQSTADNSSNNHSSLPTSSNTSTTLTHTQTSTPNSTPSVVGNIEITEDTLNSSLIDFELPSDPVVIYTSHQTPPLNSDEQISVHSTQNENIDIDWSPLPSNSTPQIDIDDILLTDTKFF